uniref:Uncharacterized protein n=1 Tax=Tetradesmus obliquus TaxID=3088 RepID=A0A383W7Z9_TETOB|eukprot:jgi/Sobl393_1/15713/SZX73124.1
MASDDSAVYHFKHDQIQAARTYSSSCSSSLLSASSLISSSSSSSLAVDSVTATANPVGAATTRNTTSSAAIQAAASAVNAVLHQQRLQLPNSFAVPNQTTVPAYQLVGLFRIFLGWPNLPQGAKATSLEAKWRLLQLTLLHAAQQEQQFQLQLQQLVDGVLLLQAQQKLAKVLANLLVPQPNKDAAQQRYNKLHTTCLDTISRWAAAATTSPAFQHLQPAMAQVQPAMIASLAAGNWQCAPSSASSGKMMEAAAVAVLQQSLPAGWSLLPSLHLLGADGQAFVVQQGCKYEADMLVLDEQGVAVAIVEVKLAAANPLMSLFNDCSALLRLVDQVRGKTLTAITRSDLGSCAAAAAGLLQEKPQGSCHPAAAAVAGVAAAAVADPAAAECEGGDAGSSVDSLDSSSADSSGGSSTSGAGSAAAKARAAAATAPFASSSAWQTVHVQVHPGITPVYVLGKSIGEAEVSKGLASLVDSAALKLLSKAPAVMAQAIMQPQQQQQQLAEQHVDGQSEQASSSSSSSSRKHGGSQGPGMVPSRVPLSLSAEQQRSILQHAHKRMEALERCMIYSLCAK